MSGWRPVIGPDGHLNDYIRRPGDPEPPTARSTQSPGSRRRWGNRVYLIAAGTANPAFPTVARNTATFVDTGDLGEGKLIDVQVRFAAANNDGTPVLPFTPVTPASFPSTSDDQVVINVRRGLDPDGTTTVDTYTLGGSQDVVPFDIISARSLGVDVQHLGTNSFPVWVEVIATESEMVSRLNQVPGWGVVRRSSFGVFVAAIASPANKILLTARAARSQFLIVNTSTNADMIINFGTAASWVGPVGSVVLPANSFATYESPVGGYNGLVSASWNAGAPNGGAIVTEGAYF